MATDLFTRRRKGYLQALMDGDLRWGLVQAGILGFHTRLDTAIPLAWLQRLRFQLHLDDGQKCLRCRPEWVSGMSPDTVALLHPEEGDAAILAFVGPDPMIVPASWVVVLDGNIARIVRNRSSNKMPCPPPPSVGHVDEVLIFPEYPPPAS